MTLRSALKWLADQMSFPEADFVPTADAVECALIYSTAQKTGYVLIPVTAADLALPSADFAQRLLVPAAAHMRQSLR